MRNDESLGPAVKLPMNRHRYSSPVLTSLPVVLLVLSTLSAGCHRQYYRKQADGEAYCLLDEKASDVARPPNIPLRIEVDRRSRMFNPFDLDFQPMPLDDPASYRYMQCVDGRRGYPMWEAAGLTNGAESPDWWQFLPLDDDGVLVLNAENAVRIALLHSPEYQEQLEQLYFVALDVSGERFQFDTQLFGGLDGFYEARRGQSNLGIGDRDLRLSRNFTSGASLVVGLANDIVWNIGGSGQRTTSTLLDFSFVQPLLRNAGRDVIMEGLTQSERELLASVRAFERFRRSFYLNVTTGNRIETTVQTAVGNISLGPSGFANAGGFLGLLQTELEIRNSKENIARQTENLLILEDSLIELLTTIPDDPQTIVRQRLQVAQARQQLLSSQQNLVSQQAGFQLSVDQFLRTLGLPPYLCVKLDDPILDQFELIDRTLLTRREELSTLRANVGAINVSILERGEFKLDPDTGLPVSQIEWTPELADTLEVLRKELAPLEEFTRDLIDNDLPTIQNDIKRLAEALPERTRQSAQLEELYKSQQDSICGLLNVSDIDEAIFETSGLEGLSSELQTDFEKLSNRLNGYLDRIKSLQASFAKLQGEGTATTDPRVLAQQLRDDIILASQDLVAELGDDVLLLQLIQAQARTESVLLPEVDISPDVAFEIARKNRRDYANARAALVDSWRQIEVVADDLESDLDLVIRGQPALSGLRRSPGSIVKDGQLNVGLEWDAPITRLLERNAYRAVLIRYEQRKRDYYQFEDTVWQVLRAEVRQLQRDRLNFELGRNSVRIAAEQIELNADIRQLNDARGQGSGPTAARDAIQALNDLLRAQNGLLGIFVNYEVVRRNLDLDMGTMELTPEGLWIDPGKFSPESLLQMTGTTVDGLIECGCNDCGLKYNPLPREPEYSSPVYQMSHTEPVMVDGVPVELIPESDGQQLPTQAEPLQSVEEAEIPLPPMTPPTGDMPLLTEPILGEGLNSPLPPDPVPPSSTPPTS